MHLNRKTERRARAPKKRTGTSFSEKLVCVCKKICALFFMLIFHEMIQRSIIQKAFSHFIKSSTTFTIGCFFSLPPISQACLFACGLCLFRKQFFYAWTHFLETIDNITTEANEREHPYVNNHTTLFQQSSDSPAFIFVRQLIHGITIPFSLIARLYVLILNRIRPHCTSKQKGTSNIFDLPARSSDFKPACPENSWLNAFLRFYFFDRPPPPPTLRREFTV